jgi:hypothetical protein
MIPKGTKFTSRRTGLTYVKSAQVECGPTSCEGCVGDYGMTKSRLCEEIWEHFGINKRCAIFTLED